MVSVRTSIFGRPRRLPDQRRADLYTLNCEEPLDPILSIKLSVDATAAAALSGQLRLASELAESVAAITRAAGPAAEPTGDLLIGSVQAMRGDGNLALALLDRCRSALDHAPPSPELVQPLVYLATSYHFIDAFDHAMPLFDRSIALGREHGAIGILPFAIAHLASSKYRMGKWDAAYADATEALALAEDSGRLLDRPIALVMLGLIDAARGDSRAPERAREAITGGSAVGAQFVVAQGLSILGLYELSTGHPAAAIAPLQQCGDKAVELGLMELGYLQWAAELVEAHVRSGSDQYQNTLAIMEAAAHSGTTPLNLALLARCHGLTATDDSWEAAYTDALRLHRESRTRPLEQARTQLCFGERLRRSRRRKDARAQLTAAWDIFETLGAASWTQRAARELAATGGTTGPRSSPAGTPCRPPAGSSGGSRQPKHRHSRTRPTIAR
jgi:tetratricopeptide (TPR) repeat protein